MMKKLIKSFRFLFLITILSSSSAFAKNGVNSFTTKSQVAAPIVTAPVYLCQNSTAAPLTATPSMVGATLKWYTALTGGISLTGAPTPITTTVGSTTYYVTETVGTVESTPRTPIVVNVVGDNSEAILFDNCTLKPTSIYFDWANIPNHPANAYNYSYSIQGGSPVSGNANNSSVEIFGVSPGQSVTLTITSVLGFPCVPVISKTCGLPCITTVTPTFNPISTSYCINDALPILPTTTTNPTPITGTWSPFSVDTSTMGSTTYTFTPDPILFPCALTYTLTISVEPIEPNFVDFPICSGDPASGLSNVSPNGISGTWNPSTVDNMTSASYVFTPDAGQPCTSTDKTINVTVNPSNSILNLNWTVTDAFSKNQIVTVTEPLGVNYIYQLDNETFQVSNVFENVSSGIHAITVKDVNGCSELTNNNVLVIGYPKFFTPNEDSYNDTWNIVGLKDQLNSRIYIFDRYGKLLKDISPTGAGWDGNYTGHPMPASDYWFTVEYSEHGVIKKFKSHFSLKR